jgi:riboflavin synthase
MFTGLIETLGTVVSVEPRGTATLLGIRPEASEFSVPPGGSVAVDGACLTLEKARGAVFYFTAVAETIERTTLGRAQAGARVNLERPLMAGARLDGHMVLGHVDGVGTIISEQSYGAGGGKSCTITVPSELSLFMAEKGSVAIDGISLTIAKSSGAEITVALIPRTLAATTLMLKRVGAEVNIECDVIARYIYKMIHDVPAARGETGHGGAAARVRPETLLARMERSGF